MVREAPGSVVFKRADLAGGDRLLLLTEGCVLLERLAQEQGMGSIGDAPRWVLPAQPDGDSAFYRPKHLVVVVWHGTAGEWFRVQLIFSICILASLFPAYMGLFLLMRAATGAPCISYRVLPPPVEWTFKGLPVEVEIEV